MIMNNEMIEKIGKRIALKMRVVNGYETNRYHYELNGMLQLLDMMEIEYDIHYDDEYFMSAISFYDENENEHLFKV